MNLGRIPPKGFLLSWQPPGAGQVSCSTAPSTKCKASSKRGRKAPLYDLAREATHCRVCCHQSGEAVTRPLSLHVLMGEGQACSMEEDGRWGDPILGKYSLVMSLPFPWGRILILCCHGLWRNFTYFLGTPASIISQAKVVAETSAPPPRLPTPRPQG